MSPTVCRCLARLLALIALLGMATVPARAATEDASGVVAGLPIERLALSVTVNGVPAPEAIVVERQGPAVWLAAEDLRALGVKVPPEHRRVALQTVPGLSFAIDEAAQTLAITYSGGARQRLRATPAAEADTVPVTPSGWGGVVGYDVSAGYQGDRATFGGFVDATLYSPHGQAYASALVSNGGDAAPRGVRRLDTSLTFADPARTRRVILGDFIDDGGSLTRAFRMGGVRVTTDFALRPDLVTFPVPTIDAQAAVPSAVDLIVNGSRQRTGEVQAGSFAVSDVPAQTGLNTISVAVRDALGRERLQTVTTYASTALLARGLSAYSLAGGFVRTGYGSDADRYRDFVASASWRRGWSDRLTAEVHGEATRGLAGASAGMAISLNRFGLLSGSASGSLGNRGASGVQLAAGWERIAHPVSVSLRATLATPGWRDVAARYGAVTRHYSVVMNLSFDLGRAGSLSTSLLELGRGRYTPSFAIRGGQSDHVEQPMDPSRFVVAAYSVRLLRQLGLTASAGGDLRQRRSFYASAGLLLTFGSRSTGYVGGLVRAGETSARADVTRPALVAGDIGYRAGIARGGIDRISGGAEYLGRHGFYDVQAERTNGRIAVRASARGSLVAAGGGLFATDRLTGGFAVVDAGEPGVTIFRDHRPIGRTDRKGRLIVTNLPPWESTRIGFDPSALPADVATADSEAMVKPADRAGALVRFRLYRDSAMALRLVAADGAPLPPGARATVNGIELPVGFDGAVYVLQSRPRNTLAARLSDGRYCEAGFARPAGYAIGGDPVTVVCRAMAIASADTRR